MVLTILQVTIRREIYSKLILSIFKFVMILRNMFENSGKLYVVDINGENIFLNPNRTTRSIAFIRSIQETTER